MYKLNEESERILHPRPSPIAAAMYTLRDLGVEVIVLHGPAGCNFRASRLLERDNVRVVTSSLDQKSVIFGGEPKLINTLREVERRFNPRLVGVVGTCCAAIIGEDIEKAVHHAGLSCKTIVVNCDPYNPDNVDGAIRALESAAAEGIITPEEAKRQKDMLVAANVNERTYGTARETYLDTFAGDDHKAAARFLIGRLESGDPLALVLNAKKETSLLYADVLCAVKEAHDALGSASRLFYVANASGSVGLPKIRHYSSIMLNAFERVGITLDHVTGGPDEYSVTGRRAAEMVLSEGAEWGAIVVCGLPHAVPLWEKENTMAVATGSRALFALKKLGYGIVLDEGMAHHNVLGASDIVESRFGSTIRSMVMG
ncbi:MAG TPA: Ni-sirohydrochlorin a,c-diamide reductive cyclase catalytic subunit [Candidatus Methanofastidiosa archaeon]|nr:Ni-sirohydrochlorin a,c-diamide reductive cyclase catalytic subunit [Candidatus Methanofastidiosa archaeon]